MRLPHGRVERLYEWLNEWKTAGKGEWAWTDACGREQRFEAVIADAEPKVQGLRLIVSYNFTLGRPYENP